MDCNRVLRIAIVLFCLLKSINRAQNYLNTNADECCTYCDKQFVYMISYLINIIELLDGYIVEGSAQFYV